MARQRKAARRAEPAVRFAPADLPHRPVVPRGRVFESVLDLVGGTPLVKLPRLKAQINRLKTLKRAMYGRAGTELLRARMLPLRV